MQQTAQDQISSIQHRWDTMQRLAADHVKWTESTTTLKYATRHTEKSLLYQSTFKDMDEHTPLYAQSLK